MESWLAEIIFPVTQVRSIVILNGSNSSLYCEHLLTHAIKLKRVLNLMHISERVYLLPFLTSNQLAIVHFLKLFETATNVNPLILKCLN